MADAPIQNDNDLITIHISDSMKLRNQLRSGLLEAQRQDTGKMPVLVSWPPWLEDGIVCMFAGDFMEIIHRAIRETTLNIGDIDPSTVDPSILEPVRRTVMSDPLLNQSESAPVQSPAKPTDTDSGLTEAPTDTDSGFTEAPTDTVRDEPSEPSQADPDKKPAKRKFSAKSLADDLFATLKNKQK